MVCPVCAGTNSLNSKRMQPIKPDTKRAIAKLIHLPAINKHGGSKEELVSRFTAGATERLGEMTEHAAIELHQYLKALAAELGPRKEQDDTRDRQRKMVIGILKECGWLIPGTMRADMPRIEKWVNSTFKKRLNELSGKDLSKCISNAEKVKENHFKGIYGTGN